MTWKYYLLLVLNHWEVHFFDFRCKFNGIERDCDKIFSSTITDDGQCCSFNAMPEELMLVHSIFTKFFCSCTPFRSLSASFNGDGSLHRRWTFWNLGFFQVSQKWINSVVHDRIFSNRSMTEYTYGIYNHG